MTVSFSQLGGQWQRLVQYMCSRHLLHLRISLDVAALTKDDIMMLKRVAKFFPDLVFGFVQRNIGAGLVRSLVTQLYEGLDYFALVYSNDVHDQVAALPWAGQLIWFGDISAVDEPTGIANWVLDVPLPSSPTDRVYKQWLDRVMDLYLRTGVAVCDDIVLRLPYSSWRWYRYEIFEAVERICSQVQFSTADEGEAEVFVMDIALHPQSWSHMTRSIALDDEAEVLNLIQNVYSSFMKRYFVVENKAYDTTMSAIFPSADGRSSSRVIFIGQVHHFKLMNPMKWQTLEISLISGYRDTLLAPRHANIFDQETGVVLQTVDLGQLPNIVEQLRTPTTAQVRGRTFLHQANVLLGAQHLHYPAREHFFFKAMADTLTELKGRSARRMHRLFCQESFMIALLQFIELHEFQEREADLQLNVGAVLSWADDSAYIQHYIEGVVGEAVSPQLVRLWKAAYMSLGFRSRLYSMLRGADASEREAEIVVDVAVECIRRLLQWIVHRQEGSIIQEQ